MPTLSRADRKVAAAERIPPALFYLPLIFNWIRLSLRHRSLTLSTAANPNIFTGGNEYHSVREWISVQDLGISAATVVELLKLWAEPEWRSRV